MRPPGLGPSGDTCSPRRDKNRRTGFGALGRPGSSLPPSPSSTLRFGEDLRAVLFSLLPSIFIFQGSDSSLALGVEIRWRDQISARLCVRAVCVRVCVYARARVCFTRGGARARCFPIVAGVAEG